MVDKCQLYNAFEGYTIKYPNFNHKINVPCHIEGDSSQ